MTKEKIIKILSRNESSESLTTQLIELFKKNKASFLSVDFGLKRNIFYYLLSANISTVKTKAIIHQLLDNEELRALAATADKHKQSILHHAARMERVDYLRIFIEKLPFLLNMQDSFGNTPLHTAVLSGRPANVRELVGHGRVNRLLLNNKNKSAAALAENIEDPQTAEDIKKTLEEVDLTSIKLPEFMSPPHSDLDFSSSALSASFPRLSSSPRHGSPAASSSSSGNISLSLSNALSNSNSSLSTSTPGTPSPRTLSPRSPSVDKKDLIAQLHECSEEAYPLLLHTLFSYCHTHDLGEGSVIEALKIRPDARLLINDCQQFLSPVIKNQMFNFRQGSQELLKSLAEIVIRAGIMSKLPPVKKPDFIETLGYFTGCEATEIRALLALTPEHIKTIDDADKLDTIKNLKETHRWLSTLWLICTGHTQEDGNRLIKDDVFSMLNNYALGLKNKLEFSTVLKYLIALFPLFDYHQQLLANYLAVQLLVYNASCIMKQDSNAILRLHLFARKNIKEESLTGSLGQNICERIKAFLKSCEQTEHPLLLQNWQTLAELSSPHSLHQTGDSFDEMVSEAISKVDTMPNDLTTWISRELKMHCKAFYQQLSFHPYYSEAGIKIIAEHTRYFNQLSNYFSARILQAKTPVERLNTLRFMLQLSSELFRSEPEYPRDLNHLKLICGVLNTYQISRLKDLFEQLTPDENNLWTEINDFFRGTGRTWTRKVSQTDPDTLLPLSDLATDCEFAHQNDSLHDRLEVLGKVFPPLQQLATRIQCSPIAYNSDLTRFLGSRVMVSDYELGTISYGLHRAPLSPKMDVLNLDNEVTEIPQNMLTVLQELSEVYLNKRIVPSIILKNRLYPAEQITVILFRWAGSLLSVPTLEKEQISGLVKEFRKTMLDLIRVIDGFEHSNHQAKINPITMLQKINKMETALLAGDPLPEESPPVSADKPARKGSMRIRGLFHNPFKSSGSGSEPASSSKQGPRQ